MKSESVVQSEIRLEAGAQGILLWRNNVGACNDETGRLIRYGLGNDSAQVQRRIKSSDLIGLVQLVNATGQGKDFFIFDHGKHGEPEDPGYPQTLSTEIKFPWHGPAAFLAVECKEEGWRFPASWRGFTVADVDSGKAPPLKSDAALRVLAQWRFLCLVHNAGGLAGFAQSTDDFARILKGELVLP